MSTGGTTSRDFSAIRMRNPAGSGCVWMDTAYEPDDYGVVTVPSDALLDLLPQEFRPVALYVPDERPGIRLSRDQWLRIMDAFSPRSVPERTEHEGTPT